MSAAAQLIGVLLILLGLWLLLTSPWVLIIGGAVLLTVPEVMALIRRGGERR